MKTFKTLLESFFPESLFVEELKKESFIKHLPRETPWKGGVFKFPKDFKPEPQVEVMCPVCGGTVLSWEPCLNCAGTKIFKKGDIIKPIKNSRFQAEQWRHIVVHVRVTGLCILDFHNNVGWIPNKEIPEMELVKDADMKKSFYREVMCGHHDSRFDGWG